MIIREWNEIEWNGMYLNKRKEWKKMELNGMEFKNLVWML